MKIGLVGGIYGKGGARLNVPKSTPETTLEGGFRDAGHDVTTLSHYDDVDFGRFDVVHVHHLSYGALRLAADKSSVPFLFTPHATNHLGGGSLSWTRRVTMRYVMASADAVITLSDWEAQATRATYGFKSGIVATIPNAIDATTFHYRRGKHAGQGAPWQLLFCGQLIRLKRCDLLLRAVAQLREDVELTLVYQNAELERELMGLSASLGIARRVHFHGKADPQELAALYQKSDLLVLPSETEALPSVITEAMLCGLPFVASAVGGVPQQANGFGVVLERRSPEAIAAAIAHVFENYSRFEATGPAMSQYSRTTFAIDSMVHRHLELYRTVLTATPRRHVAKLALPNALVRLAAKWRGTAGPPLAPPPSTEKVASAR